MSENFVPPEVTSDVTQDDKLWALLAYVLTPIIPIIILFLEDKKNRPYIRVHNIQALVWGIIFYVVVSIVTGVTFGIGGLCLWPIGLALSVYWGYRAYMGQTVEIPVISNFVRNQGWA